MTSSRFGRNCPPPLPTSCSVAAIKRLSRLSLRPEEQETLLSLSTKMAEHQKRLGDLPEALGVKPPPGDIQQMREGQCLLPPPSQGITAIEISNYLLVLLHPIPCLCPLRCILTPTWWNAAWSSCSSVSLQPRCPSRSNKRPKICCANTERRPRPAEPPSDSSPERRGRRFLFSVWLNVNESS